MKKISSALQIGKDTSQKKILWYVVRFPESNEYSVIPTHWILEQSSENDPLFCKWPPYKVTSDHLKKGENPTTSWDTYRIKIIGANKVYDNFNKAWHKKLKEKYSSSEADEGNIIKNNKRPLLSSDDETDSDADSNFKIMPPTQKKHVKNISLAPEVNVGASTSTIHHFYEEISENEMITYTELMPKEPKNSTDEHFQNLSEESCYFPQTSNEYNPPTNNNAYKNSFNFEEKFNNIHQELIGIKLMLNRVLSKLENNSIQNNDQQSIQLDNIFLNKFPINDADKFISIENCISNEYGFESKLEYFIKTIGGNTPKNHVNRVMAKLFTDQYGIQCTWTGRGKNIVTKIGNSKLIMAMKKSIQESCTNTMISDSEFEKVVSEWLRHANTRFSRHSK